MKIQIGDFLIRSYRRADGEAIVRHANNPRVVAALTDQFPHPYTADQAQEWLDVVLNQGTETLFALARQDELIGGIGLHPQPGVFRRSAELGYWLGEDYWGRGIASAAVVATLARGR